MGTPGSALGEPRGELQKEDLGEKRKTPSEGFLNEGMEPFWLKERFPTVPEAMGEDKKDFFPQLPGTVERRVQRGEGGDGRPTAGQAHHCSSSGELKAAVQLLGQALIVH